MCRRFGKLDVKAPGLTRRGRSILPNLRVSEEGGIPGVVVKCVDIGRNTSGEGGLLGYSRRSDTKARVANGIRDPGSPSSKRCRLGVGGVKTFGIVANAISLPPGDYGRKVKTQRN